jgi:hypothetical protein
MAGRPRPRQNGAGRCPAVAARHAEHSRIGRSDGRREGGRRGYAERGNRPKRSLNWTRKREGTTAWRESMGRREGVEGVAGQGPRDTAKATLLGAQTSRRLTSEPPVSDDSVSSAQPSRPTGDRQRACPSGCARSAWNCIRTRPGSCTARTATGVAATGSTESAGHCCILGSCVGSAYMGGQPRSIAWGRSS